MVFANYSVFTVLKGDGNYEDISKDIYGWLGDDDYNDVEYDCKGRSWFIMSQSSVGASEWLSSEIMRKAFHCVDFEWYLCDYSLNLIFKIILQIQLR